METAYWIILTLIVIILLCALDFMVGRKLHLANLKRVHYPERKSQLGIFTHGPELFEDYFTELRKAKKHIHILFYIVKNDQVSQEFMAILKDKASKGIEVRLLVDWVGSSISRKQIKQLKESGVEFVYSQKLKFPCLFYRSQIRNHRKITVIDGVVGYAGGFNIGKEYIDQDKKLTPWRDYHLKMTAEGVQDLQTQFLLDWQRAAKINLLQKEFYFPNLPKGDIRHQLVPSEGNLLEGFLLETLKKAEKSIFIGTPYFIPSQTIFTELLAALDRGIEITLLVPIKADHILVKEASYPYLRRLIKKGATVYQYHKGFYHAKVLMIDDRLCDLGTANFDKRSMFLNFELNCLIYDPLFINRVQMILRQDLLDSKQANLANLNRFNPIRSLLERAAQAVSYFL